MQTDEQANWIRKTQEFALNPPLQSQFAKQSRDFNLQSLQRAFPDKTISYDVGFDDTADLIHNYAKMGCLNSDGKLALLDFKKLTLQHLGRSVTISPSSQNSWSYFNFTMAGAGGCFNIGL